MNGVQRPKRWQQVILRQPLTINDPARTAFSWWNETNRIGWLALIRLVPCLSFHLYAVDFNSNIKTLTTKITESNSYLRTRTTVPHVFWNPWESKNRRVPAVYRPLFWCGRVGLGRAGLISDAQKVAWVSGLPTGLGEKRFRFHFSPFPQKRLILRLLKKKQWKQKKRETKRKKDGCNFKSRVLAALPHVLFRWVRTFSCLLLLF